MDLAPDYCSLMVDLERQELEKSEISSRVYEQLLVIYLATNDFCNAKFLWKRVPSQIKEESNELKAIWEIGKRLIRNEPVYDLIDAYEWPPYLSNVVKFLKDEVRKRALQLIGKSYSYIRFNDFMKLTGVKTKDNIDTLVTQCKWTIDRDFVVVKMKKPPSDPSQATSNQEQLEKLAEYVAFLENY